MIDVLLSRINAARAERGEAALPDANALRNALLDKAVADMTEQITSEITQISETYRRIDADGQVRVRRACGLPS